MGPASSSMSHTRYTLPASIILSPRELKQYRRWQSLHTTLRPTERGFIPTATEYHEFQHWLQKQDSGYFSDIFSDISEHVQPTCSIPPMSVLEPPTATVCRHTMHPVTAGQPRPQCPVCTIDIHLNYMKVLTRSFQKANGRPLPRTGTPSEQQENLYCAWSQAKISTLRQVYELEDMAAREVKWSDEHPEVQYDDVKTATRALEVYWFETAGCRGHNQCNTKTKTVVFADDTNFSPGRPVAYFLRSSPRYEPGKYTILEEEYVDDDAVSEDSEDYSQATVFVMDGPDEQDEQSQNQAAAATAQIEDPCDDLEDDDSGSDREDVDSDEEDNDSSDGSYVCFEAEEETSFVVFAND